MPTTRRIEERNRYRIELRADAEWIARVERQAERLGVSVSAYVRMATVKELERDERRIEDVGQQ